MAETNTNNPLTIKVDENVEVKAIFKRIQNPPVCYSIKNSSNLTFSALYRPVGLPSSSSDSFVTVLENSTAYVCSTVAPIISNNDLLRSPGLATSASITTNGTSCTDNNNCQPPNPANITVRLYVKTSDSPDTAPNINNTAGGRVEIAPGISTTYLSTSPQQFPISTVLKVRAVANNGYLFKGWEGGTIDNVQNVTLNSNEGTTTLTQNINLVAIFQKTTSPPPPPPPQQDTGTVVFEPLLSQALQFVYTRGSTYPSPVTVTARNTSTTNTFKVELLPNTGNVPNGIQISPNSVFTLAPNASTRFSVSPTPTLLENLRDGTSDVPLTVNINVV